jgi:hypothetical protein
MKRIAALGLASALAIAAAASPANARQGCGPGFHRSPNGMCRPNRGQQQVWVVGRFYPGHGYWYNNRWYQRRMRDRNRGWRYR